MITNVKALGSKLAMAESSYNSAFGVIEKIQKTAESAATAAGVAANKAEIKRREYADRVDAMESKRKFYLGRARKIAAFIADLG